MLASLRLEFVARRENTLCGKLAIIKRADRLIFWPLQLPQVRSRERVWRLVSPYKFGG
jgi:hypothetical protein